MKPSTPNILLANMRGFEWREQSLTLFCVPAKEQPQITLTHERSGAGDPVPQRCTPPFPSRHCVHPQLPI